MNHFLEGASNFSKPVDHIALILLLVCTFFIVLVWTLMIFLSVRYRASNTSVDRSSPPDKNRKLEYSLMAVILIFGLTTFGFSARLYARMYSPPSNAREIFGVAKQWMWIFHDPSGKDQINEFTIPVNTPVKLTLISEDVIHSLFIPAFRVKQDVLPNRYTTLWFTAEKTGDYPLFCTQYCGLSHSRMLATVHVVGSEGSPVASVHPSRAGEQLFQAKGCFSCHSPQNASIGPSLIGLYGSKVMLENGQTVTADENYLRESLLNPAAKIVKGYRPVMPPYQGVLTEEEVNLLITYLKELSPSGEHS